MKKLLLYLRSFILLLDIPKEKILLDHRITQVKWCGASSDEKRDLTEGSGAESDDSSKTVIDISEKKTPCTSTADEDVIEIRCENGTVFKAQNAICTLPLGVLKKHVSTLFVPPLPDYKVQSIERLLFGTVDKIFLGYDRPFLNPNISEVLLLWESDCDTSKTDGENGAFLCISSPILLTPLNF